MLLALFLQFACTFLVVHVRWEVIKEVKMMLTEVEKNEFVKITPELTTRIFQSTHDSKLFFKVLVNFVEKTNMNKKLISSINASTLDNNDLMQKSTSEILEYMARIASEENDFAPSYTTGQLATYFGVSITTINNWIKEGRFVGVARSEKNAQARIKANTYWRAKNNSLHLVSDIINEWEEENNAFGDNQSDYNEVAFLINQMALYEAKHGGDFEHTLGLKSKDEMRSEEATDLATWKYLRKRFEELNDNRPSSN